MYYSAKMSRHSQNGLSFVPKTWVPKEATGGPTIAIAGKRITTSLSLYPHSFLLLSVSFSQSVAFPVRPCSKPFQHIDIVGLNFEEHIKQAGQLTELLLLFHENSPKENQGSSNTKDFVDNNCLAYCAVSPYH